MPILNKRLILAAELIGKARAVVDVGTDHGFLPIYMIRNNLADRVIATDIANGPLSVAKSNIKKYKLEEKIETRLTFGLDGIRPEECDAISITGMGGDTIVEILEKADWLKNKLNSHTLVLQPMSADERLREYLNSNGFEILKERAVVSQGRIYTVIKATFNNCPPFLNADFCYIGKLLKNPTKTEIDLVKSKIKTMTKCKNDIKNINSKTELYNKLERALNEINKKL